MSAEAVRRAPSMSLRELVTRYQSLAGDFATPLALSTFALGPEETEQLFAAFDEDYHISRYLHFSQFGGERFRINGVPATHVSLDAAIKSIL